MVARRGNAPRSAGCEPAALLLSYRAMKNWYPHPVMLRGLRLRPLCGYRSAFAGVRFRAVHSWLRTKRIAIAPCGRMSGGAPRIAPPAAVQNALRVSEEAASALG